MKRLLRLHILLIFRLKLVADRLCDWRAEVLESAPVGTTSIPLPMARDPDSPPNAAIQYSTEPRLPPQFELTTTSTTDPTGAPS